MTDKVTIKQNSSGVFTLGGKDIPAQWDYLMLHGVQILPTLDSNFVACRIQGIDASFTFRRDTKELITIHSQQAGFINELTVFPNHHLLRVYSEGHDTKKPFTFTRGDGGWTCKGKKVRWVFPKDTYSFEITNRAFDIQLNDSIPPLRMSIDDGVMLFVKNWEDGTLLDTFDIPADSDFLKGVELHSVEKLV